MPSKSQQVYVQRGEARRPAAQKGYFSTAYNTLTSAENATVVRSVAIFGVSLLSFCKTVREMVMAGGLKMVGDGEMLKA